MLTMNQTDSLTKYVADYSKRPGPRYINQGKSSGEDFYKSSLADWFKEAVDSSRKLVVVLDGTDGYLSSFLDESFGRLVYVYGKDFVVNNLIIVSKNNPGLVDKIISQTFNNWQIRRDQHLEPKNTIA